ncbi:PREDICTED: putative ankyrin repeat protein RF_0381 [Acropora digitifera]|uniref:putative ankyrin repeat protein RF_0381 n=1 Tax=Acropora digitifera TaxID=70779 RepID=UPI00077A545F|nr:PREDICTED: putative ankyrin repeat protein RF_0381 [Acropora digitifera]
MNCRTTGEKASIFPGKSAADILAAVKGRMESHPLIGEIYEEFVETEKTLTQLHSCAKSNHVEMAIELVLNYGMDVNVAAKRNITPLVWASPATSSLWIKTVIDLGADVNAQTFQESTFGYCSGTALRSAIHGNNANVVKVLLANKSDPIVDLQGNTVLHSSTSEGLFNISQLLIDSGCNVNGRNNSGETSLHSAVRGKNVAVAKLLLRNNADANIQDDKGNTPLHVSTREGLCDISQLLVDSGCNKNLKNREGKTPLDLKPFPYFRPYPGDSEEAKGSEGYAYASQKRFRHKRFFESEDKGDPLVSRRTLPSPPPPLLFSPRSGSLSKNRPEESSALRKRRVGGVKRKMKINPEAESSPVVGKGKEQSSK